MPLRPFNTHVRPDDEGNAVPQDFDTPTTEAVLQVDGEAPEAVPVRLTNKVRVDQLPTRLGQCFTFEGTVDLVAGPVKIVPENPRRASVTLQVAGSTAYRIARTPDEARRNSSSFLISSNSGPYRFHWTDALYAMKSAAGGATDTLSVLTEDWAR